MRFTRKEKDKIVATVRKKVAKFSPCPICGRHEWEYQDGVIFLEVQRQKGIRQIGGSSLACVPLACKNCGNTHLLNLITLGLRHLIEEKKEAEKKKGQG